MEAELLFDGRTRFVVALPELSAISMVLIDTMEALHKNEIRFRGRAGVSAAEVGSILDEISLIRYALIEHKRPVDPRTGQPLGPTDVRTTGTAWDRLPKMDAELLADGQLALTLARDELALFANAFEVALASVAPNRSRWEEGEFRSLVGFSTEEAEKTIAQLRRMDQKMRSLRG